FNGRVAERHLENLKIVRHVGLREYKATLEDMSENMHRLWRIIMEDLSATDIYHEPNFTCKLESYFGKAIVVPFPFCVVIMYDEDPNVTAQLRTEDELEAFVAENRRPEILEARENRIKLRALEGHIVTVPGRLINSSSSKVAERTYKGKLSIERTSYAAWGSHRVGPGFHVTVSIKSTAQDTEAQESSAARRRRTTAAVTGLAPSARVLGHSDLGIGSDFRLSSRLSDFFEANETAILIGLADTKRCLQEYRDYYLDMLDQKDGTLSYAFFSDVYCDSEVSEAQLKALLDKERHQHVRRIPHDHAGDIRCLYARLQCVYASEVHMWWYIFWDDLYRRNWQVIQQFRKRESHFSPYSPESICYRPMPRDELERFIAGTEKGGYRYGKGIARFLHAGVLNRLYARLDALVKPIEAETVAMTAPFANAESGHVVAMPPSSSFLGAAMYATSGVPPAGMPAHAGAGNGAAVDDLRFPEPSHDGNSYW
ncbi:hypothetical protein THASP1DRAFT_31162, partial [Thamnocephalis sphaerospora]